MPFGRSSAGKHAARAAGATENSGREMALTSAMTLGLTSSPTSGGGRPPLDALGACIMQGLGRASVARPPLRERGGGGAAAQEVETPAARRRRVAASGSGAPRPAPPPASGIHRIGIVREFFSLAFCVLRVGYLAVERSLNWFQIGLFKCRNLPNSAGLLRGI